MTNILFGSKPLSAAEARELLGKPLDRSHYDELVGGEDVYVENEEGQPLLILRHRALDAGVVCRQALRRAAKPSQNRGGKRSGTVGFYDRQRGYDYCRMTPFTREDDDEDGWQDVQRLLRNLDKIYRCWLPEVYAMQQRYAQATHPDFVIPGTVFTTATVNNTVAFTAHQDKGNLALGFSVMTVLRQGTYSGGLFVLPGYRLAVDMWNRDVVLFPSDAWHGNTRLVGTEGKYERLSVVAYYRSNMIACGSAAQENARANRI